VGPTQQRNWRQSTVLKQSRGNEIKVDGPRLVEQEKASMTSLPSGTIKKFDSERGAITLARVLRSASHPQAQERPESLCISHPFVRCRFNESGLDNRGSA
jgi:hypothetical protein